MFEEEALCNFLGILLLLTLSISLLSLYLSLSLSHPNSFAAVAEATPE
jgi:hypothetical protein